MGVFNCAATVGRAIESILKQTYRDWELIICDDCSTDDTYSIVQEYVRRYPRQIWLIRNEVNARLAYSLNHCLMYARGKYVARMDGDDISCPQRLARQVEYLCEHPNVHLVGTAMRRFSEAGLADVVAREPAPDRFSLRYGVPFNHATIMTYRWVYQRLGGYTVAERTKRSQDYDLWFRFFHAGFCGRNLPEVLYLVEENLGTIRRRTLQGRLWEYQTTLIGYRMLQYPICWYLRPTLGILKGFVPARAAQLYRKVQSKRLPVRLGER